MTVADRRLACADMAHPRRFRFGIQLHSATSGAGWAEQARKAEDLGCSTLLMPDHFGDQLAPVSALRRWDVSELVFQGDTIGPLAPVVAALAGT